MTETIGKITLDLSKYPGEDFYCDGTVEDELLQIARDYSPVEYGRIIEEKKSWPILYHLSPLRENIVDFIPFTKEDKVLEVGSGCGAITGVFSRKAGSVTCVDLSKKRSMINAYRHTDCENVTIHVGNFKDIEPTLPTDFNYICLIGVFEYGQAYIGGETPYEDFLKILLRHLAPGGRIVIAIENRLGMKYFAGCKEDHLGDYFSGIEGYPNGGGVRTFSRPALEQIFANCGVENAAFYYPYPDYKFMTTVYSDGYLPGQGELCNNFRNFDRDRMLLFDEKNAFDGVVKDGLFSVFANSYVAVIGGELPVMYTKYSNDRAPQYQIKTVICKDEAGNLQVRKYSLTEEAREHVRSMKLAYENLCKRYENSVLAINKCQVVETAEELYAAFEFVSGRPLSELMDACVEKRDYEGFYALFEEYMERVGYNEEYPVADYDLIFANILVDGNTWTLIDYEWTFGKAVSTRELAFRAIYCYILEDEKRNAIDLGRVLDTLHISEKEAEEYRAQEADFQKFVTGKRLSMGEIRNLLGGEVYTPEKWIEPHKEATKAARVQIYQDTGSGYKEEESVYVPDAYVNDTLVEFEFHVSGNVQMLRVDPSFSSCMCKILEMTFNEQPVPLEKRGILITNGKVLKGDKSCPSVVFPTMDPNINIAVAKLNPEKDNIFRVKMEVVSLPLAMAEDMARAVKKLI
ncbi:MAG: class I SAM-dependent methyltransferase [Lachnospiraceae bacterium]|nr:class I SAM-dependent methyltransferase [Lachnospiraceae bacterium]